MHALGGEAAGNLPYSTVTMCCSVCNPGTGRTLYALGANRAAVRCIEACADKLVASGDDGNVIVYKFGDCM